MLGPQSRMASFAASYSAAAAGLPHVDGRGSCHLERFSACTIHQGAAARYMGSPRRQSTRARPFRFLCRQAGSSAAPRPARAEAEESTTCSHSSPRRLQMVRLLRVGVTEALVRQFPADPLMRFGLRLHDDRRGRTPLPGTRGRTREKVPRGAMGMRDSARSRGAGGLRAWDTSCGPCGYCALRSSRRSHRLNLKQSVGIIRIIGVAA